MTAKVVFAHDPSKGFGVHTDGMRQRSKSTKGPEVQMNTKNTRRAGTPIIVELAALRPHSGHTASAMRHEIPATLAGLVDEVTDGEIELRMWCGADAMVRTTLHVAAHDAAITEMLAAEIVRLLDPVAELDSKSAVGPIPTGDLSVWPVVPVLAAATIGYTTAHTDTRVSTWSAPQHLMVRCTQDPLLLQLISGMPEHGVSVRVSSTDAARGQLRNVGFAVLTPAGVPVSLRMRASLKRDWPGLEISNAPSEGQNRALHVSAADVPSLLGVPVAGEGFVDGVFVGAAAPIPVTPTRPDDGGDDNGKIRLGHGHTSTGATPSITVTAHERMRHMHITGRTGTGKSSLLAAIAQQAAAHGEGMLVLDPHGPLVDRILAELPAEAADRTWVIRSGEAGAAVPINPLVTADPDSRERAIEAVGEMFQQFFDGKYEGFVGPRFRERVAMGIRALDAIVGDRTSVLDVPLALGDTDFLDRAAAATDNARLRGWVKNERAHRKSNEHGDLVSWFNSKFEAFSATPALRAILGSGHDAFDLAQAMDDGRIVLVDLSKSQLGEASSRLLGFLHLSRAWEAALRRKSDRPFTVMVDEAHSMIAGGLTNMLSEGRKFGLSVVMAHQYLDQLDPMLLPAVDGNVATTVAFRSAMRDATAITKRFGSMIDPATMMTLPDLSAVTLRTAVPTITRPHTVTIDHNAHCLARVGAELDDHVKAVSWQTHATLALPYIVDTARAREGHSPVSDVAVSKPAAPRAAGSGSSSSFLDEWLAKRESARAAESGSAHTDAPQRPRFHSGSGRPSPALNARVGAAIAPTCNGPDD